MFGDEAFEFADELPVSAEREVGVDPILVRGESKLLEPNDLRLRERLPGEIGERRATPERKRGLQRLGSAGRVAGPERRSALLAEVDELEEIDCVRVDDEAITGRRGLEHAVRQKLPELRD